MTRNESLSSAESPATATGADASPRLLPWLFFVSGALALVYEVVWQRQFALIFGAAAPAAAAVLAGYFAGLGLGSIVIGGYAARIRRPLRCYALLEAGIAVGVLLVSPLLGWCEATLPSVLGTLGGRVAVAFAVLTPATFCMGGTLPLLGRLVDGGRRQLGVTAGWLYVVNTAGAALGALAVPFVLLPQLGLAHTVLLGAAVNVVIAFVAWWLDGRSRGPADEVGARPVQSARTVTGSRSGAGAVGVLALISGGVTFALQALWNRAFAQVHENSLHSFAVIVAVVIFALALGAQGARLGLRRGWRPGRLLGGAWMLAALGVMAGPWIFFAVTDGLRYLPAGVSWAGHAARLTGVSAFVLLVPVMLLGVGLPALMEQAGRDAGAEAGRVLGRLLAVNVTGSVAGALFAGFLLPSWLGLWGSVVWLGLIVLGAGAWCWTGASRRGAIGLVAIVAASVVPVMQLDLPRVRTAGPAERVLSVTEGAHGITAVVERGGSRRMKLNNHYALGGTASTGDERMQVHLPLLLHPSPKRVALLGVGTGISAGAALFHPVERLVAVELVPEVLAAARIYFAEANGGVLDDRRTRVVADDARHFLRGTRERFDVIVGDLVVPWRQGEGALLTLEQFRAARAALAPDGLFCQWLPLFQLAEEETMLVVRTFLAVFPEAQVWRGDFSPTEPAIALIGAVGGNVPDSDVMRRRLGEQRNDPANPWLGDVFWMHYVGRVGAADLAVGDERLNREDQPWVELLGARRATGETADGGAFTGRRLEPWLATLRARTRERGMAEREADAAAIEAGAALAELTLSMSERRPAGVAEAERRLRALLPADVFARLFP